MPTQELKDQFNSLLRASKSFKLLSAEEQANLLKLYETATDEQLRGGIEALNQDLVRQKDLEAKLRENEEKQIRLAQEIKALLKEIDKEELKVNNEQDARDSSKAADELLGKLGKVDDKSGKKKKFLGIF